MKVLKKVLKDKEDEAFKSKMQLRWAKEEMINEYRNSNAPLYKLGGSFTDGFDDCLRQVKASFPDLDLSHISIDAQGQTPACLVERGDTNQLFANDSTPSHQDDGETTPHERQVKSFEDKACLLGRN